MLDWLNPLAKRQTTDETKSSTTAAVAYNSQGLPLSVSPSAVNGQSVASAITTEAPSANADPKSSGIPSAVKSAIKGQESSDGIPGSGTTVSGDVIDTSTAASTSVASNTLSGTSASTAAANSQSTSASVSKSSSGGSSLSTGAIAGIVIGVAIGLALLTFLATFLCMRKRRGGGTAAASSSRRRRSSGLNGSAIPLDSKPKATSSETSARGASGAAGVLGEDYLPQSADDGTVEREVKTTLEQIAFHVETFYQGVPAAGTGLGGEELARFDSPHLSAPVAALLPKTTNGLALIKHSLAQLVVSSIMPSGGAGRTTLLPPEFTAVPANVGPSGGGHSGPKAENTLLALSKWRVLTAYLRSTSPSTSSDAYASNITTQTQSLALSFSNAFAPYKNTKYRDDDCVRNLSEILKHAADLGIWLFSQPSGFRFFWVTKEKVMVVLPGLVKESDEHGKRLREGQVLVKAVLGERER